MSAISEYTMEAFSLFLGIIGVILTLVSLLLLCGCIYLVYIHNRYSHLPGPRRSSFFLGNFPELKTYIKEGKTYYDYLLGMYEQFGPVCVVFVAHRPLVVVTDPLYIKQIFIDSHIYVPKTKAAYSKMGFVYGERALGYGLATNKDKTSWLRRRQTIAPAFHRQNLKKLMTPFNEVSDKLSARLATCVSESREVSMLHGLGNAVLDAIAQVAFGIDLGAIEDTSSPFRGAVGLLLRGIEDNLRSPFSSWFLQVYQYGLFQTEVQRSQIEAVKFLRDFARKCISKRFTEIKGVDSPNDILSYIVKCAEKDSTVTMEDLVDEFITMFFAAHDTTANSLSLTLFEVISNPEIEQKILEEVQDVIGTKDRVEFDDLPQLKYVGQCIMEGLRKFMIAGGPNRDLMKDIVVGGYKLPAGCSITANKYAISQSESFWRNPKVFDPSRFESPETIPNFGYTYFPFSLGPRNCIGQTFAIFEQKVLLARLIQKFKFRLAPGQTSEVEKKFTLAPRDGVRCTVELR